MEPKQTVPVSAFAKVLRSFQTGGVSYTDFLSQVGQQLTSGASPLGMLEILRRREAVEPLPTYAHTALFGLLSNRHQPPGESVPPMPPTSSQTSSVKPSAHPEFAIVRSRMHPEKPAPQNAPETTADASKEVLTEDEFASSGSDSDSGAPFDLSDVIAGAVAAARDRGPTQADMGPPDGFPPEPVTVFLEEQDLAEDDDQPTANGAVDRGSVAVGDFLANRFALLELIGVGGMSRVFKATDATRPTESERFIAVKVLTRPFNEQSGPFSEFQKEVQKLQSLSHPNIVRLFECDRDNSTVFMTMEYLTGVSLYARLCEAGSGSAPREDAHAIVMAIAEALDYAHAHSVIHGDLKPGNVIITDNGEIKLIDFGITWWIAKPHTALDRREAAKSKLASGVTPRYASPQLMARHKPEVADDVYALACLAYEVFTGTHPFDDGEGAQTLRFPPPMRPGLTVSQYTALVNGLQFERRQRTATVREFMDEFAAVPGHRNWKRGAAWMGVLGVLIVAALVGWFVGRPSNRIEAPVPAAVQVPAPEAVGVPVPAVAAPVLGAAKPSTVIRDCPDCPTMTVLPTGSYSEGSPNSDADALSSEKPQHQVTIAAPFALATNAVTVADFREFVTATGRNVQGCDVYDGAWRRKTQAGWKEPGFVQTDTHPVTCVSWNDATAYARWLSGKTRHIYRLPSAAEWEYAARAGSGVPRPWGANGASACTYANVADQTAEGSYPGWNVFGCADGYVNTSPVGTFKANAFGLNDMLGNVFAWTQDCWHPDYTGAPDDGSARMDGDCSEHELRGGSWFSAPAFVRAPYRNHFAADYRTSSVGIRLVREISP